jgi:hypothetical protein
VLTSTAIYANTPRKCLGQWSNFIAALKVIRIVIEKFLATLWAVLF